MKTIEGLDVPNLACRLEVLKIVGGPGESKGAMTWMGMQIQPTELPSSLGYEKQENLTLPVQNVRNCAHFITSRGVTIREINTEDSSLLVAGQLLADGDQANLERAVYSVLSVGQTTIGESGTSITVLGSKPLEQLAVMLEEENPARDSLGSLALETLWYAQQYAASQISTALVPHAGNQILYT